MTADDSVLHRWWHGFVATGQVPADLQPVQGRLIRLVHRGELPSGLVHVKTMTFPRKKDRLRYAFRALPARHEASMLQLARAAGIPCPEVVAAYTCRRFGLPHRSMLVLRSLPLPSEPDVAACRRLDEEIALAQRLLAVGIYHRDLHSENFVLDATGQLNVLDMQSASRIRPDQIAPKAVRLAVAGRLLRDRGEAERAAALPTMRQCGLLLTDAECNSVISRANSQARHYQHVRIRRCLMNSTEFERRPRWNGIEYRLRGELPDGRWWPGGPALRKAWIGQRVRHIQQGVVPMFAAFFQKWWWLGGGAALYVPDACLDERIEVEVGSASSAAQDPLF